MRGPRIDPRRGAGSKGSSSFAPRRWRAVVVHVATLVAVGAVLHGCDDQRGECADPALCPAVSDGGPVDAGAAGAGRWSDAHSRGTDVWLSGVWGSSATDVWIVGYEGTILRWDGSRWDDVDSGASNNLVAVWGATSTDVWAVGDWRDGDPFRRWDGGRWRAGGNLPASGVFAL